LRFGDLVPWGWRQRFFCNVDKFASPREVTFLAIVFFVYRISHLYAHQHPVQPLTWFRFIDKSGHLSFCCAWKKQMKLVRFLSFSVWPGLAHILPLVCSSLFFFVLTFFLFLLFPRHLPAFNFVCNLHALLLLSLNDLFYIYLFHFLPYFVLVLLYSLFIYASCIFPFFFLLCSCPRFLAERVLLRETRNMNSALLNSVFAWSLHSRSLPSDKLASEADIL